MAERITQPTNSFLLNLFRERFKPRDVDGSDDQPGGWEVPELQEQNSAS